MLLQYLNDQEIFIIKLLGEEKNTEEIADIICLSKRTVEEYRARIMAKLKCRNIVGVVIFAIRNGLYEVKPQK